MSEHHVELRKKVEARRAELQEAFKLAEKEGPAERTNGLAAQLTQVDNAVKGGWDHVSEVGAAELTKWLGSTQSMIVTPANDATKKVAIPAAAAMAMAMPGAAPPAAPPIQK